MIKTTTHSGVESYKLAYAVECGVQLLYVSARSAPEEGGTAEEGLRNLITSVSITTTTLPKSGRARDRDTLSNTAMENHCYHLLSGKFMHELETLEVLRPRRTKTRLISLGPRANAPPHPRTPPRTNTCIETNEVYTNKQRDILPHSIDR